MDQIYYFMGFEKEEDVLGKFFLDLTTPEARHKLKRTYRNNTQAGPPTPTMSFPALPQMEAKSGLVRMCN